MRNFNLGRKKKAGNSTKTESLLPSLRPGHTAKTGSHLSVGRTTERLRLSLGQGKIRSPVAAYQGKDSDAGWGGRIFRTVSRDRRETVGNRHFKS